MATDRVHVYRLAVTLPPEADDPDWEPAAYEEVMVERYGVERAQFDLPPFRWPSRRHLLGLAAAKRRAALLERYGAKVEIIRSLPVEFPADAESITVEAVTE